VEELQQASVPGQVLFCAEEVTGALGLSEAGGTKAVILSCGQRHLQRRGDAWLKGMA